VTDPEIRRFFMLIPEAAQLVLHAAAIGETGMVYVLEMGEQIRLVDLARNLIRLAGYVPNKEIAIEFVGLRPGEKLYEELVGTGEAVEPSSVPKILRVRGGPPLEVERLESQIGQLVEFAELGDSVQVIRQLRAILPTFEPTNGILAASDNVPASTAPAFPITAGAARRRPAARRVSTVQ
jgi:FlaA1/EpsC-like NDP-sugar epimerase